jgi:CxxC motif-containing protein (DUF1111 family)
MIEICSSSGEVGRSFEVTRKISSPSVSHHARREQAILNREALDLNQAAGSNSFFAGNGKFITRKLWGIANQPSFGHHGLYTTMREAVLADSGEALNERVMFENLSEYHRDSIIEFRKSLQILPPGVHDLVINENSR